MISLLKTNQLPKQYVQLFQSPFGVKQYIFNKLPTVHLQMINSNKRELSKMCLAHLSDVVYSSFYQICVQNEGRSIADGLRDLVSGIVDATLRGKRLKDILREIEQGGSGEFKIDSPSYRFTASDLYYLHNWIKTVYFTTKLLPYAQAKRMQEGIEILGALTDSIDQQLISIVQSTLKNWLSVEDGELELDKALQVDQVDERTISPQFMPFTQLILLTIQVRTEMVK
eukprot:TRINITY_DN925_c0_g4_i2.p2 TRINITY_DN925_c0_g4~~TRINITY_DN925_c0_g4_i2.p2  ORF type:complete len:227 (+),score=7.97 TRINITY_DN925_c0_g4_i2:275-955(+)